MYLRNLTTTTLPSTTTISKQEWLANFIKDELCFSGVFTEKPTGGLVYCIILLVIASVGTVAALFLRNFLLNYIHRNRTPSSPTDPCVLNRLFSNLSIKRWNERRTNRTDTTEKSRHEEILLRDIPSRQST